MKPIDEYNALINQIDIYKNNGVKVPRAFYARQFEIVTEINDKFEKEMIEDIGCYTQCVRYNMILKYLAEKIGKPVDEYKQKIRDYVFKISGEDVTEEEMNIVD